jgi:hypothetical protein
MEGFPMKNAGWALSIIMVCALGPHMATHAAMHLDGAFTAVLEPENEVPAVEGSDAFGHADLELVNGLLSWEIHFFDLRSELTGAHFHSAPSGSNGPVVINILANSVIELEDDSGISGAITGEKLLVELQIEQLEAGLFYINLHNSVFPFGEIRGQVLSTANPVPLPAAIWLFAPVLGALGLRRRAM